MKKLFLIFLFFSNFCFPQKAVIFKPYFEPNKSYFLNIYTDGKIQGKKDKSYHEFDDFKKIELKFKQQIGNEFYYSWKILENIHKHKEVCSCNNGLDYIKGLEIVFKTNLDGKYLGFVNVENAKKQIIQKLTPEAIKLASKKSNDRFSAEFFYNELKNDPSYILRNLEFDIRKYFEFYGINFKTEGESFKLKRTDFPFDRVILPVNLTYKLTKSENQFLLSTTNIFSKENLTDDDWQNISKTSFELEDFKKIFNAKITEDYIFNDKTGSVQQLKISIVENIPAHNNSVLYQNYSVELSF